MAVAKRQNIADVRKLLQRLKAGDQSALEVLYDTFFQTLWSVAILQTQSADTAQDVVHDVFTWLWVNRDRVPDTTDLQVYLASAVRNRARNLGRHKHVVDRVAQQLQIDPPRTLSALGTIPLSDEMLENQEFLSAYRAALHLLTERERTAVLLRWEEGFTLEQVAQVLEISTVGARGVILRVQEKLRRKLAPYRS